MPYKNCHGCKIDDSATEIVGYKEAKTKWGIIRLVLAKNAKGETVVRNMELPSNIPVSVAQHLCKLRGGEFSPATPLDPRQQVLSEGERLDLYLTALEGEVI